MSIRPRSLRFFGLLALALAAPAAARADVIVNINARYYGFAESATVPTPGSVVTPFSDAPGGDFKELTLTAGTYKVTNAAGEFGAQYDAFRFNESNGQPWAWNFLVTNASDGNKAVLYGEGSGLGSTAAEVASQSAVRNFTAFFTLTTNATLNFSIRDYYLNDNAGGVSIKIAQVASLNPAAVPEPTGLVLLGLGSVVPAAAFARRRLQARSA